MKQFNNKMELADAILFFDGNCPFCSKTVMQLAKLDVNNQFLFIANTSDMGKKLLQSKGLLLTSKSTIITKVSQKYYIKTKAIYQFLSVTQKMPLIRFCMKITPLFISNKIYTIVATNRLRIVKGACEIPTKSMIKKFVLD